jgi:hypothetical protein
MAAFLNDTFTEASNLALESHTPETGGTWSQHPNFTTNTMTVVSAGYYVTGSAAAGTSIYKNSATPPSADYYVSATVRRASGTDASFMGVCGRMSASASTFVQAWYKDSTSTWELSEIVAGTTNILGTYVSALATSTSIAIELRLVGTSAKFFLAGVERISGTTEITAAGLVGIRARSSGRIEDIMAEQIGGVGGSAISAIANHLNRLRRA